MRALMDEAIAELQKGFLDAAQIASSRAIMGMDTQLIDDGTYFVVELDGQIVGWASLSPFRARAAYDRTVENALYVRPDLQRRGIGSALLEDLIERARAVNHHCIIAVIDAEQPGSITLHERHGFVQVARLRQVGFKFGQWLDVLFLQLLLHEAHLNARY